MVPAGPERKVLGKLYPLSADAPGMKRRVPQHDRWTDGSPRDPGTLTPEERADWLEDTHTGVYVAVLRRVAD